MTHAGGHRGTAVHVPVMLERYPLSSVRGSMVLRFCGSREGNNHMPLLGVTIAIFQAGQILLTRREDFEVWCLPGGAVDDGESLAQAAMREAREETGLEVELTWLVGIYSRPTGWHSMHLVLFAARPIGGALRPDPREVIEMSYFDLNTLPEPMMAGPDRRSSTHSAAPRAMSGRTRLPGPSSPR